MNGPPALNRRPQTNGPEENVSVVWDALVAEGRFTRPRGQARLGCAQARRRGPAGEPWVPPRSGRSRGRRAIYSPERPSAARLCASAKEGGHVGEPWVPPRLLGRAGDVRAVLAVVLRAVGRGVGAL